MKLEIKAAVCSTQNYNSVAASIKYILCSKVVVVLRKFPVLHKSELIAHDSDDLFL